jgi:hypothetical protein
MTAQMIAGIVAVVSAARMTAMPPNAAGRLSTAAIFR